jgi:predicted nucleic acid-binding protein
MIHSVSFTCVLDTNILVPIVIRDILFWFAHYDLYTPKWSQHIFDEWEDVMKRMDVPEDEIEKRKSIANAAFPDALVTNYSQLINGLKLPDEKDKHVMAAAIKTNANIIVTNNVKDFPEVYLATYELSVRTVDNFLTDIIDLNNETAKKAFLEMVLNRKNPPMDEYEVLDSLRANDLNQAADYLHTLI